MRMIGIHPTQQSTLGAVKVSFGGLSQTSGVDGWSGMAANLVAPVRSDPHDPEYDC
jgi:hypothetical protein